MFNKARKAFKKAQEDPDLSFEFSELAGYLGCGVVESFFIQAFLKGYKKGKEEKNET